MTTGQVLFAGGSGVTGRHAIRWFRQRHPDVRVLVGGRNLDTAGELAREVGHAEAVAIDLDRPHMGLGADVDLAAVVMLAPDDGLHGLRHAQDSGVPYLSIGNGLTEMGPEMAMFAHRPTAAPVVLASHIWAGASVFLALRAIEAFDVVHTIRLGAIFDAEDTAGPAAIEDMQRLSDGTSTQLAFVGGRRTWLTGDAIRGTFETIDGRTIEAEAYSAPDIVTLHAATGAPDIRFDLATDASSSRRGGGPVAAETVVEIEGEVGGETRTTRSTLEFSQGQASLTSLSLVLALSAVLGLDGSAPSEPGLYLPDLLLPAERYLDELRDAGATIVEG